MAITNKIQDLPLPRDLVFAGLLEFAISEQIVDEGVQLVPSFSILTIPFN